MANVKKLEGAREIAALGRGARVLLLCALSTREPSLPVLQPGAACASARSGTRELIEAIRAVARGGVFLLPDVAELLLRDRLGAP